MREHYVLVFSICLILLHLGTSDAFCELKEEKEEKVLEVPKLRRRAPLPYKLSSQMGIFFGYDSNVNLDSTMRNGDTFEEYLYSMNFTKPWIKNIKLKVDYDMDYLNYNEVAKASSVLNHLKLGISKKFPLCTLGADYDIGIFYYPNYDTGDFFLHKALLSVRQDFLRRIYHRVQFEVGEKRYIDRKAMGETVNSSQDKKRQDERLGIEYKLGIAPTQRISLEFKSKFSANDSNARYVDFYDYDSYRQSVFFGYRLTRNIAIISDLAYIRKDYKSRRVTSETYEQEDDIYAGTIGFRYKLDKGHIFSLYYSYKESDSNEALDDYSGSIINCGYQYKF